MAATTKTAGLGDDLYADGYHIGGDIQSLVVSGGPATLDVTDITQSAHSRLGGLRAGAIKVVSYHDSAAPGVVTSAHNVYSQLQTTDVGVSYLRGQALGNPVACCWAKQLNYDPTRAADGSLTLAVDAESNGFGVEWGIQLTADPRTDTTATTGAAYDLGAGGTFGAQAYLQLVSLTGTNVDVSITHATTSGGSYTTLIDFGSQTVAPNSFRGTASGTVNEFLKVVTTGTFSQAVFFVAFMLNPVAVVF
jgi:hypothetical protein